VEYPNAGYRKQAVTFAKVPGLSLSHRVRELASHCFLLPYLCWRCHEAKTDLQSKQPSASTEHFPMPGKPAFVVQGSERSLKLKHIPRDNRVFVSAAVCVCARVYVCACVKGESLQREEISCKLLKQHHTFGRAVRLVREGLKLYKALNTRLSKFSTIKVTSARSLQ